MIDFEVMIVARISAVGGGRYGRELMEDYEDIIVRLESIAEELSDRGMDQLRSAIDSDGNTYDDEQKRIGKARRAVEKAAHILRGDPASPW